MKKLLLLFVSVFVAIGSMSAQTFNDITAPEEGTSAIQLNFGVNYFRFAANESGTIAFHVGWTSTMIYLTDRNADEDSKTLLARDTDDAGNFYTMDVEAGTVYYFSTSIVVDATTMYFGYTTADSSIKLSCNYSGGEEVNTLSRNVEFTLDRTVSIDRTLVVYGNGTEEVIPSAYINAIFVTQYFYTITLSQLIDYLMDGGKIAVGDEFTIRLEGIADANNPQNVYGEDGTYSVTLKLGELPATLTGITPADGSTIYTYYPEGGEDGFIVFTFSEALDEDPSGVSVSMSWGDMEAGSYQAYYPDFTISGNTVTVDIRGIRIPETVDGGRGSTTSATTVSMSISGLKTADGRGVSPNYPQAGTSAILAFFGVEKQNISFIYDFIPENGSTSLEGYSEIMVWLNNPILYDGVTLTWSDARGGEHSREFTPEQAPFEWSDEYEGYVTHISLAGISYTRYPVTVTVNNAYLMNGDPVTITGTFNNVASGITEIAADGSAASHVRVYSLGGVLVGEGFASSVLDGLAKGVYIVGGKKVAVK